MNIEQWIRLPQTPSFIPWALGVGLVTGCAALGDDYSHF